MRYEQVYLQDVSGQSEVEYGEIKRPRLDMGAESLMRHPSQRLPLPLGGAEDVVKVSDLGQDTSREANESNELNERVQLACRKLYLFTSHMSRPHFEFKIILSLYMCFSFLTCLFFSLRFIFPSVSFSTPVFPFLSVMFFVLFCAFTFSPFFSLS